jgi:hypothetical protein
MIHIYFWWVILIKNLDIYNTSLILMKKLLTLQTVIYKLRKILGHGNFSAVFTNIIKRFNRRG